MSMYHKNQVALFLPQGRLLGPAESLGIDVQDAHIVLHVQIITGFVATKKIGFTKRSVLRTIPGETKVTLYNPTVTIQKNCLDALIEKILGNRHWSMRQYRELPKQWICGANL